MQSSTQNVKTIIKTKIFLIHKKKIMTKVAVNSTTLYVIAFLFTTMMHELFHALFGIWFNTQPVLHHNYVEHLNKENVTTVQNIVIVLAGPTVSLTQGIIAASFFYIRKKTIC